MKKSQDFIDYIVDMLSPIGEITVGRMFGGVLLKHNNQQLGAIWGNSFYFRVPKSMQEKFKKHGSQPFQYAKKTGMVTVKAYWSVPDDLLEDSQQLVLWAKEILSIDKNKKPV